MRGQYLGVLMLALFGVAIASYSTTPSPSPPKTCKERASMIPGVMTTSEKNCDAAKECSQCCDEHCSIVTCNNCDHDCPKQCAHHPKVIDLWVDITCNVDDYWNVECIICDCPDVDHLDWNAVLRKLKERLLSELTESEKCKMGSMFNDFRLTCGLSTKEWSSNSTHTSNTTDSYTSWPQYFPFQCKFAKNWRCIFTDRSFKDVHIRIEKPCHLVGKPACIETTKKTVPDCYNCDTHTQSSWRLSGTVLSVHKTCKESGPQNKCVKSPPIVTVKFSGCSELCLHADKGETCNVCTTRLGVKTPRTPPLCVNKNLHQGLYYNRCNGTHHE